MLSFFFEKKCSFNKPENFQTQTPQICKYLAARNLRMFEPKEPENVKTYGGTKTEIYETKNVQIC